MDKLMIEIPVHERITAGDFVEKRWGGEYNREYKVKAGKNGNLIVKYQMGKHWYTDDLPPDKLHQSWKRVTESPALRFVTLLKRKTRVTSSVQLQGVARRAIMLAIDAHLRFDPGDFERFGTSYYGESEYRHIIESGNTTALAAIEQYMKREPFLFEGYDNTGSPERLYIGKTFLWEGLSVRVTSIQDENHLIACKQNYDQKIRSWKTERIFRISRDDLLQHKQRVMLLHSVAAIVPSDNREYRIGYQDEETPNKYFCSSCRKRHHIMPHIDALEAVCVSCGCQLYTNPLRATLLNALATAERYPLGDERVLPLLQYVIRLASTSDMADRVIALAYPFLGKSEE